MNPEEADYLTRNFGLYTARPDNSVVAAAVSDLLDEEKCAAYLDRLTEVLSSPSRMVTASMFSKRYAFLAVASGLFALSAYNKSLDARPEQGALVTPASGNRIWPVKLHWEGARCSEPTDEQRPEWREAAVLHLFAGHVSPLWRVLSKVAQVPMAVLWENTAVRIFSLYEKRMSEVGGLPADRVLEDFNYVVRTAPAAVFGEKTHPLTKFYAPRCGTEASSSGALRIRRTCCFYYEVSSDGGFCKACPKAGKVR